MDFSAIRLEIDGATASRKTAFASSCLAELWSEDPGSSIAWFVISRYEALRQHLALKPFRLATLHSFTVEPSVPLLRAGAFTYGIDLDIYVGDFNAYTQETLDEHSSLYAFKPDAVILAVQTRDVAPDFWRDQSSLNFETVATAPHRAGQNF